jgi:hypothetical protein
MGSKRSAALVLAGLILMACGDVQPGTNPSALVSPTPSQEPTPSATSPSPTPTPTVSPKPAATVGSVTCSGGPGTALVVVGRIFVYDVADPMHPRLVCRGADTVIHVVSNHAIAYTKVVAGKAYIIRRDLITAIESRISQLHGNPDSTTSGWTSDGSLEVYGTSVPSANDRFLVSVHLWSKGADHVLYRLDAGPGGLESRWSPRGILEFSPDRKYLAISDFPFFIYGTNVRIFSVADRSQKIRIGGSSSGGTWIANDRFAWSTVSGTGSLKQWTPAGGVKLLRSGAWYGAASSPDGRWLAGTLLTDPSKPRVLMASVSSTKTFLTRGLASTPGFVTPTWVWYAEEKPVANGGIVTTWPDGNVHAFDLTNATDHLVVFRAGEKPVAYGGNTVCCSTEV